MRPTVQPTNSWAWAPRTATGIRAAAIHTIDGIAEAAPTFRSIVIDLPAGLGRGGPGADVLVCRGDEHSLERIVSYLQGDSTGISPVIIINDAVTLAANSRARAIAKALEARAVAVLHLRTDPALGGSPITLAQLTNRTKTTMAQALLPALRTPTEGPK